MALPVDLFPRTLLPFSFKDTYILVINEPWLCQKCSCGPRLRVYKCLMMLISIDIGIMYITATYICTTIFQRWLICDSMLRKFFGSVCISSHHSHTFTTFGQQNVAVDSV